MAKFKRSVEDKLRTAINLTYPQLVGIKRTVTDSRGKKSIVLSESIRMKPLYSQKELAEAFGISTRTLRRFKNENHPLSNKTIAAIRRPVNSFDRALLADLKKGAAFTTETKTTRGVKRKRPVRVYHDAFKLPILSTLQYPVIYPAKEKQSFTIRINAALWSLEQKIEYLQSAYRSGRFSSWHFRMQMPVGVGYLRGDGLTSGQYVDLDDVDEETRKQLTVHEMSNPLDMSRDPGNYKNIERFLRREENAGRKVVDIYLVEKKEKRNGNKK